eukprot:Sspe_Gene.82124::Locus_53754_Transcript_2_2_Confidence_0.667_Length_2119::g.82124::m.82124
MLYETTRISGRVGGVEGARGSGGRGSFRTIPEGVEVAGTPATASLMGITVATNRRPTSASVGVYTAPVPTYFASPNVNGTGFLPCPTASSTDHQCTIVDVVFEVAMAGSCGTSVRGTASLIVNETTSGGSTRTGRVRSSPPATGLMRIELAVGHPFLFSASSSLPSSVRMRRGGGASFLISSFPFFFGVGGPRRGVSSFLPMRSRVFPTCSDSPRLNPYFCPSNHNVMLTSSAVSVAHATLRNALLIPSSCSSGVPSAARAMYALPHNLAEGRRGRKAEHHVVRWEKWLGVGREAPMKYRDCY